MPESSVKYAYRVALVFCLLSLMAGCATAPKQAKLDEARIEALTAHRQQAQRAMDYGDAGEVLTHYFQVLKYSPKDREALIGVGRTLMLVKQPARAEEYFDRLLQQSPDDAEALEGKGMAQMQMGKYTGAETYLKMSIVQDGYRWQALNSLGVIMDLQDRKKEAEAYYRRALAILPDNPRLSNNLGYSLMMAGRYVEAEKVLRGALQIEPDSAHLKNNLAICIVRQKRYQDAIDVLLDRRAPEKAYNNIGYLAMLQGDYDTAIGLFEKALEVSPRYYARAAQNLHTARQRLDALR
jgi:Flp pilus assembly protein TadD